jgi:hypothetical protein
MALGYETDLRAMGEFSASELYAMLKMRVDVFVVEQKCPYPELDGKDPDALHLRLLSGDALLASARIRLFPGSPIALSAQSHCSAFTNRSASRRFRSNIWRTAFLTSICS